MGTTDRDTRIAEIEQRVALIGDKFGLWLHGRNYADDLRYLLTELSSLRQEVKTAEARSEEDLDDSLKWAERAEAAEARVRELEAEVEKYDDMRTPGSAGMSVS